jgi:hypothetical protein
MLRITKMTTVPGQVLRTAVAAEVLHFLERWHKQAWVTAQILGQPA